MSVAGQTAPGPAGPADEGAAAPGAGHRSAQAPALQRRHLLGATLAGAWLPGCAPRSVPPLPPARWVGAAHERGHRLRSAASTWPAAAVQRRTDVLVLGGGVAGLSALRQLAAQGVDAHLLELADTMGGNSLGHQMAGMACPLGAHYLPVPGEQAPEVVALLREIGLLRPDAQGRLRPDERHLCHAPQERLYIDGAWQEGLLPSAEGRPATLAQYRRFAQAVSQVRRLGFSIPTHRSAWTPAHAQLDAQPFATWLAAQGLDDARLLAYLDYCCRDDYGAGLEAVSAWAGLHYYASRHGFHAPGEDEAEREPVFTWPEGNGFLTQALARPLAPHLRPGRTVLHLAEDKHALRAQVWDEAAQQQEAWTARAAIVALPLFVAARVLADWADPLATALHHTARVQPHAPWLVANIHLAEPLLDRLGAAPAWDNVAHAPAGTTTALGYVDAMHQSLRPHRGATVLTCYHALPVGQRSALLSGSAELWAAHALAELARLHPDAPHKAQAIDLMRWGHAMAIPAPGVRGSAGLAALRAAAGRIRFAHADLAGYSVFEEACTLGTQAGRHLAGAITGRHT